MALSFPSGGSPKQVDKKGKDKERWSVNIKLCWLLNEQGQVTDWDWAIMNTYDQHFHPLIEGFHTGSLLMYREQPVPNAEANFSTTMYFTVNCVDKSTQHLYNDKQKKKSKMHCSGRR